MQARYRALWELERVLYQRFRYTETGLLSQDVDFDVLQVAYVGCTCPASDFFRVCQLPCMDAPNAMRI